jgi:hypothetical protein
MTDKEQIELIRTRTLQQIADLRAEQKPSTSDGGAWTLWDKYVNSLQETVDWCDRKLAGIEPFEVQSRGCS